MSAAVAGAATLVCSDICSTYAFRTVLGWPTGPTVPSSPAERYRNLDCTSDNLQPASLALVRMVGVLIEVTRAAAFFRRSAVRVRIPDASFRPHSRNRELPVNALLTALQRSRFMPRPSPARKEQAAMTVTGRGRTGTDAESDRRPVTGAARRAALPRAAGFWLVAGVLFLLLFVSGAASPLYDVYQAQWRFSATTLTAVFGVYVLAFLVTLLVFGSVSDYLGRRGVIEVALVAGAGACGLFLAAHGAGLLFAARALSGVSAGAATSAGGAALVDLQPEGSGRAPVVTSAAILLGLGVGGLGTSALVQYAPAPTHLVWWLLLGACAAAAVAVPAIPETRPRRPGVLASLRPRVAVPRQARMTFAAALPGMIAAPALNGFYLSLGPALAAQVLGSPDLLWGGLVIFLVTGSGPRRRSRCAASAAPRPCWPLASRASRT